MKICTTQLESEIGNIESNIFKHIDLINRAIKNDVRLIIFPELSITGYDHNSAKKLATTIDDKRFDIFQNLSDKNNISIVIGVPTICLEGINISSILFIPNKKRVLYSKMFLHSSEKDAFIAGNKHEVFDIEDKCFSLSICYESLQDKHIRKSKELGANIYLASVAKSRNGVDEANKVYSSFVKEYSLPILMSNCLGNGAVGESGIWSIEKKYTQKLTSTKNALLIFDTSKNEITKL